MSGRDSSYSELLTNHRASECALERCLEGFAMLDGHKSMPSRESMCPGAMPGGVRRARWTQIDAIARADVLCRPLEWRLPCQMICGKAWNRSLTAVRGRLGVFLRIIARADVPWSDARRGSRRSMDTNRCHRASECALQAPRKAIALPDDLRESVK